MPLSPSHLHDFPGLLVVIDSHAPLGYGKLHPVGLGRRVVRVQRGDEVGGVICKLGVWNQTGLLGQDEALEMHDLVVGQLEGRLEQLQKGMVGGA